MSSDRPTITQYIDNMERAIASNTFNLFFAENAPYKGKPGIERLGREIGYALADYTDQEVHAHIGELYSRLVVRFHLHGAGVPLNAADFIKAIRAGRADEMRRKADRAARQKF